MMASVRAYFNELAAVGGAAWNRFWFTPSSAAPLGRLRLATGLMAFYSIAAFAPDLDRWFGPTGMAPVRTLVELGYTGQWSIFDYLPAGALWPAWGASLVVLALYAAGVGGRAVAAAALLIVLSYLGRAPMVAGEFDLVLVVLLAYLVIGRSCDAWSLGAAWRRRSGGQPPTLSDSPANTVSLRLLQVHFAVIHLMMAAAQLNAPENAWWTGEGIWLAAMRPDMPLVDFSFLTDHPRVVAAWSHAMTLYLAAMPVFVWPRLLRPLVLAMGLIVWAAFALASGWVMFSLAMLAGLLAYVEPRAATPRASDHPQRQGITG